MRKVYFWQLAVAKTKKTYFAYFIMFVFLVGRACYSVSWIRQAVDPLSTCCDFQEVGIIWKFNLPNWNCNKLEVMFDAGGVLRGYYALVFARSSCFSLYLYSVIIRCIINYACNRLWWAGSLPGNFEFIIAGFGFLQFCVIKARLIWSCSDTGFISWCFG